MTERFSPALRLADLNDFLAPEQACVVSQRAAKITGMKPSGIQELAKPLNQPFSTGPVKISLKDCLACSGCITSAETVMLEKQSPDEFRSHLRSDKVVVVSVSPQSRASLASHFNLSTTQVMQKLTTLLKTMGVKGVYDTSCSRDLVLIEACTEFISRYRHQCSNNGEESGSNLPLISSACPGWICYAEKTLGSYILPYISSVKSPQQAIGAAIKRHLYPKIGARPEKVHHVTVMPCYDKKLEAVRDDFMFSVEEERETGKEDAASVKIPEVDSVLTTGELLDLIKSSSVDFMNLEEASLDSLLTNVDEEGRLYGVHGGSGGYAETIFQHAAKTLFGRDIRGPIDFKSVRNSDLREVSLEIEGKEVLKFAICYGFRNLQNVVRKIKLGKSEYHYLEVMACPSGCLNGGGQLKPKAGQSGKALIAELENIYRQDVKVADPFDNPIVRGLYDDWLGEAGSVLAKRFLHTEYHPLVKSLNSQLHNW